MIRSLIVCAVACVLVGCSKSEKRKVSTLLEYNSVYKTSMTYLSGRLKCDVDDKDSLEMAHKMSFMNFLYSDDPNFIYYITFQTELGELGDDYLNLDKYYDNYDVTSRVARVEGGCSLLSIGANNSLVQTVWVKNQYVDFFNTKQGYKLLHEKYSDFAVDAFNKRDYEQHRLRNKSRQNDHQR